MPFFTRHSLFFTRHCAAQPRVRHSSLVTRTISHLLSPIPYLLSAALCAASDVAYYDPVGGTNATCEVYSAYDGQTTLSTGWYVVSGTKSCNSRIKVSGDVNLILADGCTLTAAAGITVAVEGSITNSLTIWAQSTNAEAGKLTANGGGNQAGIGVGNGGAVAINGGTAEVSGYLAIGAEDGSGGNGTLTLCARTKVTAGDDAAHAAPVAAANRVDACHGNGYAKIEPCALHEYDGLICRRCDAEATCWVRAQLSGAHIRQKIGDDTAREICVGVNPGDSTNITYTIDPWYAIGALSVNGVTNQAAAGATTSYTLNLNNITQQTVVVVSDGIAPMLLDAGLDPADPYTPAILNWLTARYAAGELANPDGPISLGHHKGLGQNDAVYEMPLKVMYWLDIDPTEPGWWLRHGFVGDTGREIRRKRKWNDNYTEHLTNRLVTVKMYLTNDTSYIVYAPYCLQGLGNERSDEYTGNWTSETFKVQLMLDNGLPHNAGFLPFRWFTFGPGSFDANYEAKIEILDPFSRSSVGYSYGWYGNSCNSLLYRFTFDDALETWAQINPLKADSTYDGPPFEDDE